MGYRSKWTSLFTIAYRGVSDRFVTQLESLDENDLVKWDRYKIRRGDNLSRIASRYKIERLCTFCHILDFHLYSLVLFLTQTVSLVNNYRYMLHHLQAMSLSLVCINPIIDGAATYNLCVVVDDIDSNITHVIRGDDHVNNG